MGGRKDLITAGLTLGALAGAAAKAKGKMSAIIATESGSAVSFTAADAAPVIDLTAAIVPVQSGSGDPSPENIRPISGWTECKVYRNGADTSDPTIYSVSFGSAGTVHRGNIDVKNGVLVVDSASTTISSLTWTYDSSYNRISSTSLVDSIKAPIANNQPLDGLMCSSYKTDSATHTGSSPVNGTIGVSEAKYVYIRDEKYTSAETFVQEMGSQTIVYPLATPIVYHLTPVEIRTLAGQNTIWADTGSVTVKYATTDTKAFIDKYIAERRNG